jgi:hypothetical protein
VISNTGFDDVAPQHAQPRECIGLVDAYEAGIAHHISGEIAANRRSTRSPVKKASEIQNSAYSP